MRVWIFSAVVLGHVICQVTGIQIIAPSYINVSEAALPGTILGTFTVTDQQGRVTVYGADARTKELITFKLVQFLSANDTTTSTQYVLVLYQILDRELETTITLHISVVDAVGNQKTFSVSLYIEDVNDNPPIFDHQHYLFQVSSNVTVGAIVAQVRAVDLDQGQNGMVQYSLPAYPDVSSLVAVDADTGRITLLTSLDLDSPMLSFVIRATDLGVPKLSSFTTVTIMDQ